MSDDDFNEALVKQLKYYINQVNQSGVLHLFKLWQVTVIETYLSEKGMSYETNYCGAYWQVTFKK